MKTLAVFLPGSRVFVGEKRDIPGEVTAVIINHGPCVSYQVSVWEDRTMSGFTYFAHEVSAVEGGEDLPDPGRGIIRGLSD